MIGRIINYRYEVLEKCGDGSFYSVYKARDKVLNRLVAVKVLAPQYSDNQPFAERMTAEAQNVADLTHPNIAKILEADSDHGTYFTAVEYVRGINLKDRIRRAGPFPVSHAVDIATGSAQALAHAHQQGMVHGDVRPQNIITGPDGQVKLTDFGTAKALAAFPAIREAALLRSVHYMAPEVIRGEPAQPASDVYSLGVILYEMLTGSVPFDGATSAAIAARHLQDAVPSPHVRNSAVPPMLNEIVMKALQKDPGERFANAAEMLAALRRIREWLRTGQAPEKTDKQKPEPIEELIYEPEQKSESFFRAAAISLLGVLVVAVITGSLIVWFKGGSSAELPVPDMIGKTLEQAQEAADRTGLVLREPSYEYSDQYASGQVFMTDPMPGGTVPRDKPFVRVWISKGPKLIVVPNLIGLEDAAAATRIIEAGFTTGRRTSEYSDNIPSEHIIRQSPPAGQKREPGTSINVVVSMGPEPQPEESDLPYYDESDESEQEDYDSYDDSNLEGRRVSVEVTVPEDVQRPQEVRVVIIDEHGETLVYDETHQPGEVVRKTFIVYGERAYVKVYVDGKLVRDQRY